ncbi:MAG: aconitase X catalytic domain-containing protein [Propionibacteriaceae bacterium]
MTLQLSDEEASMLAGEQGAGVAMAMRMIVTLSRTLGAETLIPITSAHIDSCLFHGQAGLDFAVRLVELGTEVRVPTTLNTGSVDLLHPGLIRTESADERAVLSGGRALMEAYLALGCRPTWTCAPYQLPQRPGFGEHIAWAESNAIVFANSVLGARTDRYGDFLDIAAAVTGRAPYSGLHLDGARRGQIVFDCTSIPDDVLRSDITYPLLGYIVGSRCQTRNPVLVGLPAEVTEDQLKAFGAAAASSGGVALFHVVGVTPEAPTLAAALQDSEPMGRHDVTPALLQRARRELSTVTAGRLDAVSIGTPHASYEECRELAELLGDGPELHPGFTFYVSTGRAVLERLRAEGQAAVLERYGVRVVVDTCTYVTSILSPDLKVVMTNSGKWAHYAPANLGIDVVLGSMQECVASARAGQIRIDDHWPEESGR